MYDERLILIAVEKETNSVWQCLSTPAQSGDLLFPLMSLHDVTFPGGAWLAKELQQHGHQREAQRTALTFGFARTSMKVLFG